MKLLVIGSGGREHALAWKLAQSRRVDEVIVAPGNAGTAREPRVRNVDVAVEDIDGLLALARKESIGLTVVGPEIPLVLGVVDRFRAAGLACFGPRRVAAQLEGSKAFAKEVMQAAGVPTADARLCETSEQVAAALPRTVTIRDGRVGGEGRSGQEYAVVSADGSLPLPPEKRFEALTVLPIAPLLARAIKEVFEDGSVTSMFDGAA